MTYRIFLAFFPLVAASCATGVGHKISDESMAKFKTGMSTRQQVRAEIGPPITQLTRENLECDSYAYSGLVNYFIFTTQDKAQSYNFCYDKSDVLQKKDGLQM